MLGSVESVPTVRLRRKFNCAPERLFDAWTEPRQLVQWFGPEEFVVERAELDVREGGSYRITIGAQGAPSVCHFGDYVAVDRPHRLVFTWVLGDQDCAGSRELHAETLVSLQFIVVPDGTELILTHEKLPTGHRTSGA